MASTMARTLGLAPQKVACLVGQLAKELATPAKGAFRRIHESLRSSGANPVDASLPCAGHVDVFL